VLLKAAAAINKLPECINYRLHIYSNKIYYERLSGEGLGGLKTLNSTSFTDSFKIICWCYDVPVMMYLQSQSDE